MKLVAAILALAVAGAAQAAGQVECTFVQPDKFTDARDEFSWSSPRLLSQVEGAIRRAALPHLADGQTLKVEVLDVDLAGQIRPGSRRDVRVLTGGADWPRIWLRWTLDGAGGAARSGEARLQDMNYLDRIRPPLSQTALVYEERMLADYFRQQLGRGAVN